MQIYFERSGGFMGRRYQAEVNTDELSPQEAEPLQELIYQTNFFDLPHQFASNRQARDTFYYRLTVIDGEHTHTIEMLDGSIPEAIQPLLDELINIFRSRDRED